jgi:hypothetical protein
VFGVVGSMERCGGRENRERGEDVEEEARKQNKGWEVKMNAGQAEGMVVAGGMRGERVVKDVYEVAAAVVGTIGMTICCPAGGADHGQHIVVAAGMQTMVNILWSLQVCRPNGGGSFVCYCEQVGRSRV